MIIKEMSPESKISMMRNVELVRKMSEKVKKGREEKINQLNKPRQSPMERFNNIKKFFQVKSGTGSPKPFDHKKFDLYNDINEGKESDDDIDDIFNQKNEGDEKGKESDENSEDVNKKNKKTGKKRKRPKYEIEVERENTNKNVNYNMNINNLDIQDDYL